MRVRREVNFSAGSQFQQTGCGAIIWIWTEQLLSRFHIQPIEAADWHRPPSSDQQQYRTGKQTDRRTERRTRPAAAASVHHQAESIPRTSSWIMDEVCRLHQSSALRLTSPADCFPLSLTHTVSMAMLLKGHAKFLCLLNAELPWGPEPTVCIWSDLFSSQELLHIFTSSDDEPDLRSWVLLLFTRSAHKCLSAAWMQIKKNLYFSSSSYCCFSSFLITNEGLLH